MSSIYGVSFYPRKLKPPYWIYIEHHKDFFLKSLLFIFVVGIFEKQETMPWRKRNALVSVRKKQPQNMIYFNLSKNFTTCKVVSCHWHDSFLCVIIETIIVLRKMLDSSMVVASNFHTAYFITEYTLSNTVV